MTLTAIFAGSCVMLIMPITKIYTHTTNLSRAQLLADTIVDSLRAECAHTYITTSADVQVTNNSGASIGSSSVANEVFGNTLIIRKNQDYYETIASNYEITGVIANNVLDCEEATYATSTITPKPTPRTDSTGITSRAVYRMFSGGSEGNLGSTSSADINAGFVHFGYFTPGTGTAYDPYDYTNPFSYATYGDSNHQFRAALNFSLPTLADGEVPTYVLCDVQILDVNNSVVYTRSTVLCFS